MENKLVSLYDTFFDEEDDNLLCYYFLGSSVTKSASLLCQDHSMDPKFFSSEKWLVDLENLYFFKLFRMEKSTFYHFIQVLCQVDATNLLNKKYTGGHHPVDRNIQLLVFLNYMATQESLLSIGHRFSLSTSTAMKIINTLLYLVLKLRKRYIKFPSVNDLEEVSAGFQNYPGVIGAIDGTHIFISVNEEQQDSYIDRYRRHSINILAICDSHKIFIYTYVGFPGSTHDSRVFENSLLFQKIERYGPNKYFKEEKYHLIGDSAFALRTWLMVPYRENRNVTAVQKRHNYLLSSERIKIEHAFGMLKQRWRRLLFIVTYNISKTIEIASAACILHNYCLFNNDIWNENEQPMEVEAFQRNVQERPARDAAKEKRDRIANAL